VLVLILVTLEILVEWVLGPFYLLELGALVLEEVIEFVKVAGKIRHISLVEVEHEVCLGVLTINVIRRLI